MKLILKNISIGLLVLMISMSFTSCAKKITFQTSSIVPAARGDVKIKQDENKNYLIQVELENLAEVSRLEPSKNAYVVWMESEDSMVKNIGQIRSDSKFLSSKLKASFETVTPVKPSKIYITAEDDADVQFPGKQLIMETKRF
ncbi:hypothetical protein [Flavobacterium degerlachei]|uniref:Lipoprotein n=1 Tax=Flavobacterium degerlachei TaxID=229203 RepID=A0A1H3BPL3_9FLAO|nr:hypothetical protein [Flavobacterium degerlachei]SDX43856.1 hypothetical protein SAMN05444338_11080 [Flavobacterium degerlachei]